MNTFKNEIVLRLCLICVFCVLFVAQSKADYCSDFTNSTGGETCINPAFTDSLIGTESGGSYTIESPNSSALGRYQFIDGTRDSLCASNPDLPCVTREEFAQCPQLQDAYFETFTRNNSDSLKACGAYDKIGTTNANGVKITESCLLAVAHLKGAGSTDISRCQPDNAASCGACQWALADGTGNTNVGDANGTTPDKYCNKHGTVGAGFVEGGQCPDPFIPPPPTVEECTNGAPMCTLEQAGTVIPEPVEVIPPFEPPIEAFFRCGDTCDNSGSDMTRNLHYYYCSTPPGTDYAGKDGCCQDSDIENPNEPNRNKCSFAPPVLPPETTICEEIDPNDPDLNFIDVTSVAELMLALGNATGGEVITLAPGDYGPIDLSGYSFPGLVTIRSQDVDDRAVFTNVASESVSNILLANVDFTGGTEELFSCVDVPDVPIGPEPPPPAGCTVAWSPSSQALANDSWVSGGGYVGGKSRVTYDAGTDSVAINQIKGQRKQISQHKPKNIWVTGKTAQLSVQMFIPSNYVPNRDNRLAIGIRGGADTNQRYFSGGGRWTRAQQDGWSARVNYGDTLKPSFYSYHLNRSGNGNHGVNENISTPMPKGQWITMVIEVVLNTPGVANGSGSLKMLNSGGGVIAQTTLSNAVWRNNASWDKIGILLTDKNENGAKNGAKILLRNYRLTVCN